MFGLIFNLFSKLNNFNRDNRFVLIVNYHNRFDTVLRKKKFVTQGLNRDGLVVKTLLVQ